MSSVRAPLFRIEERALSIGLRFKRPSERKPGLPKPHGFDEPFGRRQAVPFGPLFSDEVLGFDSGPGRAHVVYFSGIRAQSNVMLIARSGDRANVRFAVTMTAG